MKTLLRRLAVPLLLGLSPFVLSGVNANLKLIQFL